MKNIIFVLIGITLISLPSFSHPGRKDASGCHVCRKNCEKYGLRYGEKHCN